MLLHINARDCTYIGSTQIGLYGERPSHGNGKLTSIGNLSNWGNRLIRIYLCKLGGTLIIY